MNLLKFCDASTPVKPSGYVGTAFYIGGATPHVWTPSEITEFSYPLRIPIYVPMFFRTGQFTPREDAMDCVAKLKALGMPTGKVYQLDFEAQVYPQYTREFGAYTEDAGYHGILYGSTSTLFQNTRLSQYGFWAATREVNHDYPGDGVLYPNTVATQWKDFGAYDANIVSDELPIWGSPIRPQTNWIETVISNLPTIKLGSTGQTVRTWQGILTARGYTCQIDGQFGTTTDGLTRAFQAHLNVPNSVSGGHGDGIVGQHTWASGISGVAQ